MAGGKTRIAKINWPSKRPTARAGLAVCLALAFSAGTLRAQERAETVHQVPGPAGSLHIDDGGVGEPPVIFVHAFAGSSAQWTAQLGHVRKTRRAMALDLRAHGLSAPPVREDYAITSLAEDIGAVADELALDRFVLVGHGLGGAVAIAYAGAHPGRVAGLLLVGAPGKVPRERSQQIMALLDSDYERVMGNYCNKLLTNARAEVVAQVQSGMARMARGPSLSLIRSILEYDPGPALRSYMGPKCAIISPQTNDDFHKLSPETPVKLITGASHWMQMDKPEEFNRVLDEFLAGIPH